jgi:hypothetical protein
MKRLIIGFLLMLSFAVATQDNFPVIRQTGNDWEHVKVRKFEDGPNTCYVAYKDRYDAGPSISCVKR